MIPTVLLFEFELACIANNEGTIDLDVKVTNTVPRKFNIRDSEFFPLGNIHNWSDLQLCSIERSNAVRIARVIEHSCSWIYANTLLFKLQITNTECIACEC